MKDRIKKDMVTAMKAKDVVTRDILRVLKGEIERNEQSSKGKVELTDSDVVKLVKKLIESVAESGDDNGEIAVLEVYLPKQMTESNMIIEATLFVNENGLDSPRDMGKIMSHFKQKFEGTYDGKELSRIAKELLTN
jgi:uncharacterized protein YqeY